MPDKKVVIKIPQKLRFHYIKSNYFRVIHADGAYGGVSPRRTIQINFYSERQPIPQLTVHGVAGDGALSGELPDERVVRDGIVREIEAGVIVTLEAAESLRDWLSDNINKLQEMKGGGK